MKRLGVARIRTIKPDFWTSEQVLECSTNARLLFIGLWNFCDDSGRHVLSPKTIKAQVFPGDDISLENVRGMLDELSRNGLIELYSVEGKEYFQVTGWHHQRIDKPQSPKHPGPVPDNSKNGRGTFGVGKDRKGKDRKGKGSARAQAEFAFVGKVVRLTAEQMAEWGKAYPRVKDLVAELTAADDYYAEHPPPDGKWFFRVSNWLKKANGEAVEGLDDDEVYRGVI